jgi:hypothetical protein
MRIDKTGREKTLGENYKTATKVFTGFQYLQHLLRTGDDHTVGAALVFLPVHFYPGLAAGTDPDHIAIHMRGHIMDPQVMLLIRYQEIMDTPVKPVVGTDIGNTDLTVGCTGHMQRYPFGPQFPFLTSLTEKMTKSGALLFSTLHQE